MLVKEFLRLPPPSPQKKGIGEFFLAGDSKYITLCVCGCEYLVPFCPTLSSDRCVCLSTNTFSFNIFNGLF